jgi:dolichol kinase
VLFWLPSVLLSSLCVALYEALCPIHDNLTLPVYFLATLLFTGPPSLRV